MKDRWMMRAAMTAAALTGTAALVARAGDGPAPGGSYTVAQYQAGQAVYEASCTVCHDRRLEGSSHGPALKGPTFAQHWASRSSDDLLAFTQSMMPPAQGGSLSAQDYAAVTAYVLAANGHGAGHVPLAKGRAVPIGRAGHSPPPAAAPPMAAAGAQKPERYSSAFEDMVARLGAQNRSAPVLAPVTEAMLSAPPPGSWLNWRRTRTGHGDSPLNAINAANVGSLKLAWVMALPDGVNQTTPLVHDGVLFVIAPGGRLMALDAANGDFIWDYRYAPTSGDKVAVTPMRNIAIYGHNIYLATPDAALVAVDARSGREVWRTQKADTADGFTHTAGPVIANGVVISGINGCERFKKQPCFVSGHDPETGRELWRTSVIAQPGDHGDRSWAGLAPEFRAGGDMWIAGTYDPATDSYFIGTAQAKPWVAASRRMTPKDDVLYTNSTLALDPRTGRIKWWFQHSPGETLDMDVVYERVAVDDGDQSYLFTAGKDGILWKLDRKSGKYRGHVETVYQDVFTHIDRKTGKVTLRPDLMTAQVGQFIPSCPTTFGGHNWQAMAYDRAQHALIIPLLQMCGGIAGSAVDFKLGGGGLGVGALSDPGRSVHMPGTEKGQFAKLASYDVRSLKPLWSITQPTPFSTAALATAGGLVFIGDVDRYFKAFDTKTGKLLWQTRLGTAAHGFPISYAAGGKQYVAITAGQLGAYLLVAGQAGRIYQPANGNALYVFALP